MSYHQQYQYYNNPTQTNYSIRSQQSLQQQPFIPQQQNPYIQNNSKNNQNLHQNIPKNTSNPFNLQNNKQQQSSKGPQFLFSQEQSNANQLVAQQLLNKQQKQSDPKIILNYKQEKVDVQQEQNNQDQNDEEDDQEQDDVDYEDEQNQQEDDDTEPYDTEEEIENKNNNKYQPDSDKYKSVIEIDSIRKEVNKINKELDKLDQDIEGTLIMSRIKFGDQSVLDMTVSQDLSYQLYLKEFEQFKLQKQVNPKSKKES